MTRRNVCTMTRYVAVGVLNTVVGLGVIHVCLQLGFANIAANLIGYAIGITLSFTLNKRFTFTDRGPGHTQFLRFLLVTGVAYLANLATVLFVVHRFDVDAFLAHVSGVVPYTVIGYAGSRLIVFRGDGSITPR